MQFLKACVVQAASVGGNTAATVEKAVTLISDCATRGAQLAVFPEAFIGGYAPRLSFTSSGPVR